MHYSVNPQTTKWVENKINQRAKPVETILARDFANSERRLQSWKGHNLNAAAFAGITQARVQSRLKKK
jgi:hypothetical protein